MEAVVTCGLGGLFEIGLYFTVIKVEIGGETLTRTVIKIVLWIEAELRVVFLAQILHTLGLTDGVILARHVVGHEVDDNLQTCLVAACHQSLERPALWLRATRASNSCMR